MNAPQGSSGAFYLPPRNNSEMTFSPKKWRQSLSFNSTSAQWLTSIQEGIAAKMIEKQMDFSLVMISENDEKWEKMPIFFSNEFFLLPQRLISIFHKNEHFQQTKAKKKQQKWDAQKHQRTYNISCQPPSHKKKQKQRKEEREKERESTESKIKFLQKHTKKGSMIFSRIFATKKALR